VTISEPHDWRNIWQALRDISYGRQSHEVTVASSKPTASLASQLNVASPRKGRQASSQWMI
jgi:hypothetical protein